MINQYPARCSCCIDCDAVLQVGLVAPDGLSIQGSSAGGWLAASALLQQPQLFAAAVLTVPCLDPLGLLLQHNQGVLELGAAADDAQVRSCVLP